ncbi:MAG: hypothetical protein WCG86_04880 [Actinomycetota bacterium]|jgi:hypothetical protein
MPIDFQHIIHPRVAERGQRGPATVVEQSNINHQNPFKRINARFGLRVTMAVGTMWAAYGFTILALFALPSAIKQGTYFVVVWLSSSFLQLVLLPIIIVGQNIQAAAADKRAEDTYKDADAILHEALEIQRHLMAQDEEIGRLVALLQAAKLGGAQ